MHGTRCQGWRPKRPACVRFDIVWRARSASRTDSYQYGVLEAVFATNMDVLTAAVNLMWAVLEQARKRNQLWMDYEKNAVELSLELEKVLAKYPQRH